MGKTQIINWDFKKKLDLTHPIIKSEVVRVLEAELEIRAVYTEGA